MKPDPREVALLLHQIMTAEGYNVGDVFPVRAGCYDFGFSFPAPVGHDTPTAWQGYVQVSTPQPPIKCRHTRRTARDGFEWCVICGTVLHEPKEPE